jgi:hypothetical protein
VNYSSTLAATGGTAPYTWSLSSGVLPAGLSLNESTGTISGTPTAAVVATPLTFKVTDSQSPSASATITIPFTVQAAQLQITTTSLPAGTVGASYTANLAASGGVTPYTWTLTSGTLPAGLSLNPSGAISGTPTVAINATPLTFKVSDSASPAASSSITLSLTIAASSASLKITTASLPNGTTGVSYSATLAASGGTTPYTWTLTSGALPAGISLNASTGEISGTPTAVANGTALTFKVTDSESPAVSTTATLSLTVTAAISPLQITSTSLPNGTVGTPYSATLAATGGKVPYTWSLMTGTLPAGLSLNTSTGVISGTPTATANAASLTFKVTDSQSPANSTTSILPITITAATAALQITTSSLPAGTVGASYSATLTASGGTTPYTWALTGGALPAGLSLNASTGAISGTPTTAASGTELTFKVSDSASPAGSATATLSLTVSAASTLQVTTTSLPDGAVGTAYTVTLGASGGKTPYTWALTSGTLPAGLSLNATSGVISGTPTAAANATPLAFKVTDSESPAVSKTVTLSLTIASTFKITTTSLPNGTVGSPYSTTLAATGGTTPYTWTITSGTLPAGLSLNASTGVISGTPTAAANATSLAFKVTDSASPAGAATATLALTISSASSVTVSVTPGVATVNFSKKQQFTATVTGTSNTSVNWFVDNVAGGSPTVGTISSSGLYSPAASVGSHTVTAVSAANSNATGSATIYISNSGAVATYHNNNMRTGLNAAETALTASNVNPAQFGKLFSLPVDGQIFGQPLYVPSVSTGSAVHNVLVVATQHDSVYAWDADTASTTPLWKTSFINPSAGVTTVPCAEAAGGDCVTIYPEFGITSTPVIDVAGGTVYVVAETKEVSGSTTNYIYRLHALSLATGAEKFGGPVILQASAAGATFTAKQLLQRPGLLLANGVVYIAFGSHGDASPYYGWLLGYSASTLQQVMVFNASPDGGAAIWQSGCAPAADASGNIYFVTGNGPFNANSGGSDYGDSVVKLKPNGTVADYFTPADQGTLNSVDLDLGSGGHVLLPDQSGAHPHLMITAGKEGVIYLLNRDNMGKYNGVSDTSLQSLPGLAQLFGSPAVWNNLIYFSAWNDFLKVFQLDVDTDTLSLSSNSMTKLAFPGATPSVSANGSNDGIVWIIQADVQNDTVLTSVPNAILHAYDATNAAVELYNSSQAANGRDTAGGAVKFAVPTIADGKVFVGNQNQVTVYGLLP